MRLTLRDLGEGKLAGEFAFFPDPSNPDVPSGSFEFSGTYGTGGIDLKPGAWIDQPPDYDTIPLSGAMPDADGTLTLAIDYPGCDTLVAKREAATDDGGQPPPAQHR